MDLKSSTSATIYYNNNNETQHVENSAHAVLEENKVPRAKL